MRGRTLRYCGALGGLLGPLLLQSCTDSTEYCELVIGDAGVPERQCYSIGEFGKSTLAYSIPEPPGANCPNGGNRVDTGFDDNDNGALDPSEVESSAYICHGATGPTGTSVLAAMYPENPGVACSDGGMRVDYGIDRNADGVLAPEEVEGTRFVCHGVRGPTGYSIESTGVGDEGAVVVLGAMVVSSFAAKMVRTVRMVRTVPLALKVRRGQRVQLPPRARLASDFRGPRVTRVATATTR